jgi:hypothetical protein
MPDGPHNDYLRQRSNAWTQATDLLAGSAIRHSLQRSSERSRCTRWIDAREAWMRRRCAVRTVAPTTWRKPQLEFFFSGECEFATRCSCLLASLKEMHRHTTIGGRGPKRTQYQLRFSPSRRRTSPSRTSLRGDDENRATRGFDERSLLGMPGSELLGEGRWQSARSCLLEAPVIMSTAHAPSTVGFSTDDLPEKDRIAMWRELRQLLIFGMMTDLAWTDVCPCTGRAKIFAVRRRPLRCRCRPRFVSPSYLCCSNANPYGLRNL